MVVRGAIGASLAGLVAAVAVFQAAGAGSAARAPSWTGRWAVVYTCPYPNCASGTATLDLVQSGNAISGRLAADGGGVIPVSSGTASGFTATLTFVSTAFSIRLPVRMSADGASFTGKWIVTEKSSGISRTLSVTGSRAGRPSVDVSVSASPAKVTVPSKSAVPGVGQTAGGQAGRVAVTVTFRNPSTRPAANLQLLSLSVVPVDRSTAPPKLGFPASSFPARLGTLAPGAVVARSFTLDVARGDGVYKVEALALFDDPTVQGGNGRAYGVGGRFQVIRQLAIEGTVVAAPSCATPAACPAKPLPGVTVTANGPAGGQARTGFDGTYSIDVSKGVYTVTAAYRNKVLLPASRSVTVDASTVSGVDFACAPTRKAGVTTACEAPTLQAGFRKVTGTAIELFFQGAGWDPNGGTIGLSLSGTPLPALKAAATFEGVLQISRWPKRATIALAAARQNTNGYCWGDLAARQGTSFASSHVQGKWAGWVLWSADARIRAGEAWCDGEDNTVFRVSPAPIIAYGFFDRSNQGIEVFNLDRPGAFSGLLTANAPMRFFIPGHNVCVHLSATGKSGAIPAVTTTTGPCA